MSLHARTVTALTATTLSNVLNVLDMNDTCSDEDVDDILYMDDDLTYEYEEVVVGKSTPTVDENYAECVDDCSCGQLFTFAIS